MWYHKLGEYWINTESVLYGELREIAENNSEFFNPDDLIDDMYPAANYFGSRFYPSRIIRKLDNNLYQEVWNNLMDDWAEEAMRRLERYDPEEGDTFASFLDEGFKELENIVWKEQEDV